MKIAINREIGSFHLSIWGSLEYLKRKGIVGYAYIEQLIDDEFKFKRYDPTTYNYESFLISTIDQGDTFDEFDYDYWFNPYDDEIEFRTDPILIDLIEQFPDKIAYKPNSIKIVEIPDNIEFEINESEEGYEWISEKHRVWR